jgi:hypothetical protein
LHLNERFMSENFAEFYHSSANCDGRVARKQLLV